MPCNDCRFDRKKKDFSSFLERTQLMKNNELLVYRSLLNFLCCCLVTKSCPTLAPPWTVAHQASLSMGFPRQEYWSELPFPSPGDLPYLGIKPTSPALAGRFFTAEPPGKPYKVFPFFSRKISGSLLFQVNILVTHMGTTEDPQKLWVWRANKCRTHS